MQGACQQEQERVHERKVVCKWKAWVVSGERRTLIVEGAQIKDAVIVVLVLNRHC